MLSFCRHAAHTGLTCYCGILVVRLLWLFYVRSSHTRPTTLRLLHLQAIVYIIIYKPLSMQAVSMTIILCALHTLTLTVYTQCPLHARQAALPAQHIARSGSPQITSIIDGCMCELFLASLLWFVRYFESWWHSSSPGRHLGGSSQVVQLRTCSWCFIHWFGCH